MDEGDFAKDEADAINALIGWFNEFLPVPPKAVRNSLSRRATFWFRQNENTLFILEKAWELAWQLDRHDCDVQVWRAIGPPGRIV